MRYVVYDVFGTEGGTEYLLGVIMSEGNAAIFCKEMSKSYTNVHIEKSAINKPTWEMSHASDVK